MKRFCKEFAQTDGSEAVFGTEGWVRVVRNDQLKDKVRAINYTHPQLLCGHRFNDVMNFPFSSSLSGDSLVAGS